MAKKSTRLEELHNTFPENGISPETVMLRKYGTGGWIKYVNEDDYKEKLQFLARLIIEYGLDLLEKISYEEEIIPTKIMAEKLFNQHKQLELDFIEEFDVKAVAETQEEIDEWFQFIKELIANVVEIPYEEVKELLIIHILVFFHWIQ